MTHASIPKEERDKAGVVESLLRLSVGIEDIDDLIAEDVFLLVRADSGDAVLEHNDVNLLAIQVGRIVDVVMVMDRSGSMSAAVPVTAGTQTKLQMLQDSANLFIDMLRRDAGDRP